MKRTPYRLDLHNPCAENWDAMPPTAQGRFCQSCAKNVVDFTDLSDDQTLSIFNKSKGTLCGRVTETQLNRDLVSRSESTFSTRLFKAFSALLMLVSTKKCRAGTYGETSASSRTLPHSRRYLKQTTGMTPIMLYKPG
jgi:hypothetical protein